jgi:hypothetical protein
LKIHFNIILPSTPGSPHENPVCTSLSPHTCCMPRPSYSSRFDHPNNIWWWVQVSKFLLMWSIWKFLIDKTKKRLQNNIKLFPIQTEQEIQMWREPV